MTTDGSQYSGGLVEQGSIDWVALSRTTVSFSVELLARYTRAGVEPLTVAIGQALFAQSRLPADAQRRLDLSVSKLKAYSSAANALWFGIGFKHVIRTLMETEQGATLVAVSSGLMVSYSCDFSAAVLKALCEQSMLPEKLTPALSQWGALLNLCTPAVIASQFAILVEGFSRLLMNDAHESDTAKVVATSPTELAAAILELAQLSTGKIANVTLMGNSDCGWLAALAEWLFSLRVEIVDHSGNTLYQSKGSGQKINGMYHLTIIRLECGQSRSQWSMLQSRTHLVPPGNLSFNLRTETPYHLFYKGRSEWSSILTDTFGSLFHRLLKPGIISLFAQVLYSALYVHDEEKGMSRLNPWGDALFINNRMQHQRRFMQMLDFSAVRLPELIELKKYGKNHALELNGSDLNRAKLPWPRGVESRESVFEAHFGHSVKNVKDKLLCAGYSTALVDACSCGECKAVQQNRPSPNKIITPYDSHQCLSKIAIAIFEFIWFLSWLDIDDTIRPSSNALLSLSYRGIFESPKNIRAKHLRDESFSQVIELFTGFSAEVISNTPAVAIQGLCIYRPALEDPNKGVESQLRMRVVPGQIERNDKIYYRLDSRTNPWLTWKTNEIFSIDLTTSVLEMLGARALLQVAVEETLESASLNTKLVVVPTTKTSMHWNSLFRPSVGSGDDRVSHQNHCFFGGGNDLFQYISGSLEQFQCRNIHGSTKKHPLWGTYQFSESWSGRCSVAEMPWWTEDQCVDDQEVLSIAKSSKWVVALFGDDDNVLIILAHEPVLYSLLAKFILMNVSPCLFNVDYCLVCKSIWEANRCNPPRKTKLQKICVLYFSKAGQVQKFELPLNRSLIFAETESSAEQVNTE